MTSTVLIISIFASFVVTLFTLPLWINKARQIGLVWDDVNKKGKQKVSGSGGVSVVLGFVVGVLVFIAYRTFILHTSSFLIEILALLVALLFVSTLGFFDDLFGWKQGGIPMKKRILFVALAAVPFMAINAGRSTIALPFNGVIDLGLLYPLLAIPIGMVGATTTYNFLAGFNGLEAGQGVLMLTALSLVAYFTGANWLAVIGFCMVAALLAFFFSNKYPARVFPGDTMTYAIGGLIASMAILGNFERIAVFFFIPYILETGLKLRGSLRKESFGVPQSDGTLSLKYPKLYSLTHLALHLLPKLGFRPTEKNVVHLIWAFQLIIIIIGFMIFREGIFLT